MLPLDYICHSLPCAVGLFMALRHRFHGSLGFSGKTQHRLGENLGNALCPQESAVWGRHNQCSLAVLTDAM